MFCLYSHTCWFWITWNVPIYVITYIHLSFRSSESSIPVFIEWGSPTTKISLNTVSSFNHQSLGAGWQSVVVYVWVGLCDKLLQSEENIIIPIPLSLFWCNISMYEGQIYRINPIISLWLKTARVSPNHPTNNYHRVSATGPLLST